MSETAAAPVYTPLRKVVVVKATPEQAFRRFTAEIGQWWPLRSHSVGGANSETVTLEGRVGGRIVEKIRGGRECTWGTLTAWEPPHRVAFTWHPGREAHTAQDIEVRFTAEGSQTRVELQHTGFERLGTLGRRARRGYPIGWEYVLGLYAGRRGAVMALLSALTAVLLWIQSRRKTPAPGAPSGPRAE